MAGIVASGVTSEPDDFAGAVVRGRGEGLVAVVPVAAAETGRKGFTAGAELRSAGRVSPAGFLRFSLPSGHPDFTLSGQLVGLTGSQALVRSRSCCSPKSRVDRRSHVQCYTAVQHVVFSWVTPVLI